MSEVNLRPKWDKIRDKPSDLVYESTALNTLKLNDSELGGSGEVVTIQSLNGTIEVSSTTIGTDSLVLTSAMQAALSALSAVYQVILVSGTNIKTVNGTSLLGSGNIVISGGGGTWGSITGTLSSQTDLQTALNNKQDAAAFLTTLAAIGGTSGTGNLARVTSPTFVTPTLGAASATSVSIAGTGNLTLGTNANIYFEGSQTQVYFNQSSGYGVAIRGTTTPRVYILPSGCFAFANTTLDGSPSSTISQQSSGVIQIGTTGNNALGSLACAGITIGAGTRILKVLSATATLDFGSIAANAFADLTITVTGSAVGDTVALGVPNGSLGSDLVFFGWVSATNTVTVRCANNSSTTARDPASGTFRATVTQF